MDLDQLDAKQLKKIVIDANTALNRRQKVEKTATEIQRIIRKHRLNKDDLKILLSGLQAVKTNSASKVKATRSKVEPKYTNQDGSKKWTGRGRSPSWVIEVCQNEGITIEQFKQDARFALDRLQPGSFTSAQSHTSAAFNSEAESV